MSTNDPTKGYDVDVPTIRLSQDQLRSLANSFDEIRPALSSGVVTVRQIQKMVTIVHQWSTWMLIGLKAAELQAEREPNEST